MTEINFTSLFKDNSYDPGLCSGSVIELGDNAGPLTWNNSKNQLSEGDSLRDTILEHAGAVRDHFREYGAWDDDEIDNWSDDEIVGLAVQDFSAAYREFTEHPDYIEGGNNEALYQSGYISGRIFQDDDGEWWMYFGV